MMNTLVKHLCHQGPKNPEHLTYLQNLTDILVSGLMFGPVHSRGKRCVDCFGFSLTRGCVKWETAT